METKPKGPHDGRDWEGETAASGHLPAQIHYLFTIPRECCSPVRRAKFLPSPRPPTTLPITTTHTNQLFTLITLCMPSATPIQESGTYLRISSVQQKVEEGSK